MLKRYLSILSQKGKKCYDPCSEQNTKLSLNVYLCYHAEWFTHMYDIVLRMKFDLMFAYILCIDKYEQLPGQGIFLGRSKRLHYGVPICMAERFKFPLSTLQKLKTLR